MTSLNRFEHVYDLGLAWKQYSRLPFVFAAWVANKKIEHQFINHFNEALKLGLNSKEDVLKDIKPFKDFDLKDYLFNKIDYQLTDNKKEALKLFHRYILDL